jgi:hypothetical protein
MILSMVDGGAGLGVNDMVFLGHDKKKRHPCDAFLFLLAGVVGSERAEHRARDQRSPTTRIMRSSFAGMRRRYQPFAANLA